MKNKSITLVAGTNHTREALYNQLKEYISDVVKIKSYAIDDGINEIIRDDLVVLTSDIVKHELLELDILDTNCEVIVANRTISYDYIDEVVLLPKDTGILLVNDVMETAQGCIEILEKLGIDHLNFVPYCPGEDLKNIDIEIAVTPGEYDKVPKFINKIIDIGPRIMDFTTITKILNKLEILDDKAGQFSQKYLEKIINMAKRLAKSTVDISNLNHHLNLVIDGLNDGLLVYDNEGNISITNENLKRILKSPYDRLEGKNIKKLVYNKLLLEYLMGNDMENNKIFNINGVEVIIQKIGLPINNSVVATFKNVKETIENNDRIKRDLINKGLFAKYNFDDIIGSSGVINHIKSIAKKLAKSELTILIEGESGTGKELIASAIHNESKRSKGPFLAVNFSALPDELIESELFGYEEGAFTGAKKGGKPGLFEQADGGSIFLDEIGDISLKVQARLLRVLQEKEVMRIGGNEIKPIDVRVIAATNRDLVKMVNNKEFREDLYYRLKMGYLNLPPLRNRKEDIIDLLKYFLKVETREEIQISKAVIEKLLQYEWYGNVRELKNILDYMLAVRESNYLTLSDIPDGGFFQRDLNDHSTTVDEEICLNDEQRFILKIIYEIRKKGDIVGRERLAKETKNTKFHMTKYQMRSRLDNLERMGLIIKSRGKIGTILTEKGEGTLMALLG